MEPFRDAFQVMPEPVSHKHRLSVRRLDDVLQCVQLPLMDGDRLPGIRVDCAVRHLRQLPGKGCGIGGCDLAVWQLQDEVLLQIRIPRILLL